MDLSDSTSLIGLYNKDSYRDVKIIIERLIYSELGSFY